MKRLSENSVINIKNKSFSVTAQIEVAETPVQGVIIAQGGAFGGWALYAKDGKAKFVYNLLGIQSFTTEATQPIPAGEHQVRVEFPTTAEVWPRAATSPSSTTAKPSGREESRRRNR